MKKISYLKYEIGISYIAENELFKVQKRSVFITLQKSSCSLYTLDLTTRLKTFTLIEMLRWLQVAPSHIKAVNASENLPNEIRKIIYSLYRAKEITKKVYNDIMNSIKVYAIINNQYYIYGFRE